MIRKIMNTKDLIGAPLGSMLIYFRDPELARIEFLLTSPKLGSDNDELIASYADVVVRPYYSDAAKLGFESYVNIGDYLDYSMISRSIYLVKNPCDIMDALPFYLVIQNSGVIGHVARRIPEWVVQLRGHCASFDLQSYPLIEKEANRFWSSDSEKHKEES